MIVPSISNLDVITGAVVTAISNLGAGFDHGWLCQLADNQLARPALSVATRRLTEESHLIGIWGPRGSGKSTALRDVLETLSQDASLGERFVVLPPISPELLSGDTDLIDVILAAISAQREELFGLDSANDATLSGLVYDARTNAAFDTLSLRATASGMANVAELERLIRYTAGGSEQVWLAIQRLVAAIVAAQANRQAVVISVDDIDLVPNHLLAHRRELNLRALRVLSALQGVVVIITGAEDDLLPDPTPALVPTPSDTKANPTLALPTYADLQQSHRRWRDTLTKMFPSNNIYRLSPVSWAEALDFKPRGLDAGADAPTFGQLLAELDSQLGVSEDSPGISGHLLLDDARAEALRRRVAGLTPLPDNPRQLVQLYRRLQSLLGASSSAAALQNLLQGMFDTVRPAFGAKSAPLLKLTQESGAAELVAWWDFQGLNDGLVTEGWAVTDRSDTVSYQLRPILKSRGRWAIDSSTRNPVAEASDLPLLLAMQGIMTSSPLIALDGEHSPHTFGLDGSDLAFCQVVKLDGSTTDDRFLSLPLCTTLRATMRSIDAWNAIVTSAKDRHLRLDQVMALTISAVLDIYDRDDWFDLDTATIDYERALTQLDQAAGEAMDYLRQHDAVSTGRHEHLLDWYCMYVPSHWHAAIFDPDQITHWTRRLMATVDAPSLDWDTRTDFRYSHNWMERVREVAREAGTAPAIRRAAWVAGYEPLIRAAGVTDLPDNLDDLLRAYHARQQAGAIGRVAMTEPTHQSPIRSDQPSSDDRDSGLDQAGDRPRPWAPDEARDLAPKLTDYTIRRLQQWAESFE